MGFWFVLPLIAVMTAVVYTLGYMHGISKAARERKDRKDKREHDRNVKPDGSQ